MTLTRECKRRSNFHSKLRPCLHQRGHKARRPYPLTEANARLLALGLQPSPSGLDMSYYRRLAEQDPNLSLAGLRIELDILAKNLARGFDVSAEGRESGARLLKRLYEEGALTPEQLRLALKVWQLSSIAVHGQPVSKEEANDLLDAADVLADQYISWLSWGFPDGWEPKNHPHP